MSGRAGDLELAERYEAGCEAYDELYGEEQAAKYVAGLRLLRPRGRVVDVGCGTGLLIELLSSSGALDGVEYYVCVDVSSCMLRLAAERARRLCGGRCAVVQASAYSLPFRDKEFDVAYSFSVVNLLERPADALAEIARVSKSALATLVSRLPLPESVPPGWRPAGRVGSDVGYLFEGLQDDMGDR